MQNILRALTLMYISKTAVYIPGLDKFLDTVAGKTTLLTLVLWLSNKNFVMSIATALGIVVALTLISGERLM
jgi:hypothetical protein